MLRLAALHPRTNFNILLKLTSKEHGIMLKNPNSAFILDRDLNKHRAHTFRLHCRAAFDREVKRIASKKANYCKK